MLGLVWGSLGSMQKRCRCREDSHGAADKPLSAAVQAGHSVLLADYAAKVWFLTTFLVSTLGQVVLLHNYDDPQAPKTEADRVAVLACRAFIYVFSMTGVFYKAPHIYAGYCPGMFALEPTGRGATGAYDNGEPVSGDGPWRCPSQMRRIFATDCEEARGCHFRPPSAR